MGKGKKIKRFCSLIPSKNPVYFNDSVFVPPQGLFWTLGGWPCALEKKEGYSFLLLATLCLILFQTYSFPLADRAVFCNLILTC